MQEQTKTERQQRFSERMSIPKGIAAFSPPSDTRSWRSSHTRRTMHIENELWERFERYARSQGVSKSSLGNAALAEFLDCVGAPE